jgi:MFS family permease
MSSHLRLIVLVVLSSVVAMTGFAAFPVALPTLVDAWHLDNVEAGWISGAYFVGYVATVPVLVGLTDRLDARRIYLTGCLLGAVGGLGFAFLAEGFWSALVFQAFAGAGLAGNYMPGLRVLSERLPEAARLRAVPYYTSMFGVGTSLSFLFAAWIDSVSGWQAMFFWGGIGAAAAAVLMVVGVWGLPVLMAPSPPTGRHPLDFRPVFTNRRALGYILSYGGHSFELFAFRAWIVAFLLFAWSRGNPDPPGLAISQWVTICVFAGVPASILGAELARVVGRIPLIRWIAFSTAVVGVACGLATGLPYPVLAGLVFVYCTLIAADSGTITTGAVAEARPGEQGATLAVHSMVGFGGGIVGPPLVGLALDLGGGLGSPTGWAAAMAVCAAGSLVAALAVGLARRATEGRG